MTSSWKPKLRTPPVCGWLADGTLVVSTLFDTKIHHVDAGGNAVATYDLSDLVWSTNDLLVTPDGRTYVDLYGNEGAIGLVGPDGIVQVVATGLAMPNGLGLLPDGIDPRGQRDERGSAARVSGPTRRQPRRAKRVRRPRRRAPPRRSCVDVEGGVWVGCVNTGEFLRVVAGGAVTHRVEIDGGWSVAPALGGCDGRTLYMVIDDTTAEGIAKGESTGWIMQARVDVPGAGSP